MHCINLYIIFVAKIITMKKKEALIKLKEFGDKGYLTHSVLLEIFEENEEIPGWAWEALVSKPQERVFTMVMGPKQLEEFERVLDDYVKNKDFVLYPGPALDIKLKMLL